MRQVIGFLDLLGGNDEDRLVWVTANSIQKHAKNYEVKLKGKPTTYGLRMIELCLQACRAQGIISRQHAMQVQERRGFIIDHTYVVAPHDALCMRKGGFCRFVGVGRVPGTKWAVDTLPISKSDVWFVSGRERNPISPLITFEVAKREEES